MAKRVVWVVAAVLVIAFGTFLFVASWHVPVFVLHPEVHLLVAFLLLGLALTARRRASRLARVLLLCGSTGLVVAGAHDWFIEVGMRRQWFELFGDGWIFYGYMEGRERPYLVITARVCRMIGLCFPIGLLLLTVQRKTQAI